MGTTRGAVPSPNIWWHPEVYEIENRAVDPDGRLRSAMRSIRDWTGQAVLDVGCGTGFHLPMFAETADLVVGVEPNDRLAEIARRRCRQLSGVDVRQGTAQRLPVPDASIDVVHARWAYFFGPGCEPGLRELSRVVRRGGTAFIIDNDATSSTFGRWFREAKPRYDPAGVERFWSASGWSRVPVEIGWRFSTWSDFDAVVRIEFDPHSADRIVAEHRDAVAGLATGDRSAVSVDYAVNLWHRTY
jgi:SAM-dependent methyltransferase